MTDPLAPLRERFRARAETDRADLEQLAQGDLKSAALRRLVHNLAGAAGTFGYGPLSAAAVAVDDQMASGLPADPASLDVLKQRLDDVLKQTSE
jgi:HPt (histidine-containing phosphotransfer) domain-containing protein